MKIALRGVRGSIPTTDPATKHYGGNTSCVVVSEKDCVLVLDGGSGMQRFNLPQNTDIKRIDILLIRSPLPFYPNSQSPPLARLHLTQIHLL